ncbi:unnamed protein product [Urochloa humidicola]
MQAEVVEETGRPGVDDELSPPPMEGEVVPTGRRMGGSAYGEARGGFTTGREAGDGDGRGRQAGGSGDGAGWTRWSGAHSTSPGEALPGPSRWGSAAPRKRRGQGCPTPRLGLPKGSVIWSGFSSQVGLLPGKKAGIPVGFSAPKGALRVNRRVHFLVAKNEPARLHLNVLRA